MKKYIKENLSKTLKDCSLKVGDRVKWKNDYGVEWEHTIIGFNTTNEFNKEYERYVHLDSDAYWFPHSVDSLTLVN